MYWNIKRTVDTEGEYASADGAVVVQTDYDDTYAVAEWSDLDGCYIWSRAVSWDVVTRTLGGN